MFGRRKKPEAIPYDKNGKVPVIRCSICTGEQVAGFKDPVSGKFEELMLLRGQRSFRVPPLVSGRGKRDQTGVVRSYRHQLLRYGEVCYSEKFWSEALHLSPAGVYRRRIEE